MCKIVINLKERALVNLKTGEVIRPSCFDDLAALHNYMLQSGKGYEKQAEQMLKDVFKGEKVITKMVAAMQAKVEKNK